MLTVREYLTKIMEYHIQNKPSPFVGQIGLSYYYFVNRSPQEKALKNVD
jgi:hypothetical protein